MADKKFHVPSKKEALVPKTSGKLPAGAYIGAAADPEDFIKGAAVTTSTPSEEVEKPAEPSKEPVPFPKSFSPEYIAFSSRMRADLAEKITVFCAAHRTTRTKVLEVALEDFFKKYER